MAQKKLEEAKAAATKIQAMYRGFTTRKHLLQQSEIDPLLVVSEIVDDIVTNSIDDKVCLVDCQPITNGYDGRGGGN